MNRFEAAKYIQLGACNPRAIARSLVDALDGSAADHNTMDGCKADPAVRLILHQLLFVLYGVDLYNFDTEQLNTKQWHKDNRFCELKRIEALKAPRSKGAKLCIPFGSTNQNSTP